MPVALVWEVQLLLRQEKNVRIQRNGGRRKRRWRTRGRKGSSFGAPRGERGREEGERKSIRRTVRGGVSEERSPSRGYRVL